jgi:hypothetical protein
MSWPAAQTRTVRLLQACARRMGSVWTVGMVRTAIRARPAGASGELRWPLLRWPLLACPSPCGTWQRWESTAPLQCATPRAHAPTQAHRGVPSGARRVAGPLCTTEITTLRPPSWILSHVDDTHSFVDKSGIGSQRESAARMHGGCVRSSSKRQASQCCARSGVRVSDGWRCANRAGSDKRAG